jgi:lipoprotein-anchoring transpeptidase ErfK/SrfK
MRNLILLMLSFGLFIGIAVPSWADVEARVFISKQRMVVFVDGTRRFEWRVSTGRRGYETPRGTYQPIWLSAMHFSKKYDNAPMPHSIFFKDGYAIHATNDIGRLGRAASHGCVRLLPSHARQLFSLVRAHGLRESRILVTN